MVLISNRAVINKRITKTNRTLAQILTGIVFILASILIILADPIHVIVKYKLRLAKGSILYELLQHEIEGAHLSVYMFNITNANRFLSGEDNKLKVEEVGPFVFKEYRWYEDLEFSADGELLAMTPKVRSEFVPEDSIAHPKDINLTLLNLPMLSATAMLSNYPGFVRYAFNMMVAQLKTKPIINKDVHNYLWGYEDTIITICNRLAPGLVYFDRIGLLDRLYDNESDFRIVVGATDQDRFRIKSVKKFNHIQLGSINNVGESEQTFSDTYEGIGYPPMLTPDIPINLYRLGICKAFNLEYIGRTTTDYGGEGLVYTINNKTFLSGISPISSKMYPEGLLDISKCYYGLPFVISKAHFLDSDPKLLDLVDGMKPNRSEHVNEVVIDRKVSVTYNTRMALQLSMVLDDLSYSTEARRLSNLVVPVLHIKLEQPRMSEKTMSKFYLVYKIAPILVLCLIIVMLLASLALLAHAGRSVYLKWQSSSEGMIFESIGEKLLHVDRPLVRQL